MIARWLFGELFTKIELMCSDLKKLHQEVIKMSIELENLKAQVTASIDVQKSAIILIGGLAAKIVELKDDPVALQTLADSLVTQKGELAAAIEANTV
jgi:hypothetical protein